MNSYSLYFVVLSALLGILSASRIGNLVRINNLSKKPELNGKIGLVKEFKDGRAVVKTFLNDNFTALETRTVMDLPAYFSDLSVKIENLENITKEQWKPERCTVIDKSGVSALIQVELTMSEFLSSEELSLLKICSARLVQISKQFHAISGLPESEEFKIIGTWMNQVFETSFLKELPDFSAMNPFQEGLFVFIEGLKNNSRYNGEVGIIRNLAVDRTEVIVFLNPAPNASGELDANSSFTTIRVHDKNLRLVTRGDWKYAEERSLDELLAEMMQSYSAASGVISVPSSFKPQTLTAVQEFESRRLKNLLSATCGGNAALLLRDREAELKTRLIGAWINLHHGWYGMVYTCEHNQRLNPALKDIIEHIWHGIGAWQR